MRPALRWSARLHRLLLRLYPADFRDDVGGPMGRDFEERCRAALDRGGRPRLWAVWTRATMDALASAALEWRRPSRPRPWRRTWTRTGGGDVMGELAQDLRYALRMLVKNRAFTAAAVLTLAVGIGLNAATFSVVRSLLLRPLPGVEQPDRLVQLYERFQGDFLYGSNSIPHFQDVRDDLTGDVFQDVAAWAFAPLAFSDDGRSERLMGMMVSADFFQTLGVRPELGRAFIPGEEDRDPGAHAVAVLGDGFWQDRFGGDPGVIGRTITLNGHPFEVVGVAPPDFRSPIGVAAPPVYVPLMMQPVVQPGSDKIEARGSSFLQVVARLAPGVTVEGARQRVAAYYQELRERYPDSYSENGGITLVPQSEAGLSPTFKGAEVGMSAVMMAVVALLLLIACVNVANLFLARARERRREMGIRLSLGARRGRIVRQLLTESLVFSAVAGAAGMALAYGATALLSGLRPPMEGPWAFDFHPDGGVLLFTAGVSLVTGLVFGLAPALQASRADMAGVIKGAGRGGHRSRLVDGLVVAQMALSLLLLVSSGLFLRSLQGATRIDKGFRADHLLLASMDPGLQGYGRERTEAFYADLLGRVRALPGVRDAALGEAVPLGLANQQNGVTVPGYTYGENERRAIDYNVVGPGYFQTMGVELLQGRGFREEDRDRPVMVVNQRFAEHFWPGESAVGKTVSSGGIDWTVVGVAADGKYNTLGEDPLRYMWYGWPRYFKSGMTIHVRTTGDPAAMAERVRGVVAGLDPQMPVFDVTTMDNHLGFALLPAALGASVLGLFGVIGLFLAAIGIYGVMAYSVSRRRRELGIRVALGADRHAVVGMVLREGLRLAVLGAVLGVAAAALASRAVQGLLYGVSALDPMAFVGVPLLLVAVAALAVWIPARRAAAVDPVGALKTE